MKSYICSQLTEKQIRQITALHLLCSQSPSSPEAEASDSSPAILSLVLPEPGQENDDTFYALYEKEETLLSFLSVFCPDGETAEISGFTHPSHRNLGYFSALLKEAKQEISRRFGKVRLLFQCLSENPDTIKFCKSRHLEKMYSECIMRKNLPVYSDSMDPQQEIFLKKASMADRSALISLHMDCFQASFSFTEEYMDTLSEDDLTTSFLLQNKEKETIGLLHLTRDETGRIAYFMGFGILPAYRRRGYGRAAIFSLMTQLKDCEMLLLQVSTANTAAFRLYRSLGFSIETRLDYFSS